MRYEIWSHMHAHDLAHMYECEARLFTMFFFSYVFPWASRTHIYMTPWRLLLERRTFAKHPRPPSRTLPPYSICESHMLNTLYNRVLACATTVCYRMLPSTTVCYRHPAYPPSPAPFAPPLSHILPLPYLFTHTCAHTSTHTYSTCACMYHIISSCNHQHTTHVKNHVYVYTHTSHFHCLCCPSHSLLPHAATRTCNNKSCYVFYLNVYYRNVPCAHRHYSSSCMYM